MTIEEQVDKIMRDSVREALRDCFAQMEYEYKVFKGILPMPEPTPIKCPFTYKDKS